MFSRFRILVFFVTQLLSMHCYAQLVLNTQHYSTQDGLADNRITVITKDREGFVWFGSWAGISRFDGYQFKTFKSYPGDNSPLKSNRIDEIVEDGDGDFLWLGAYDRHIYRFDKKSGIFVSLSDLLQNTEIGKITFSRILAVSGSDIWLRTEHAGILLLRNSSSDHPKAIWFSQKAQPSHRIPSNDITLFHLDQAKNVWLSSALGTRIVQLHASGEYIVRYLDDLKGISPTYVTNTKTGVVMGTSNGMILSFDRNSRMSSKKLVTKQAINHILLSKSGSLYFTTSGGSLLEIDKLGSVKTVFTTKQSTAMGYIFEDSSGVLWLGSQRHGVIRFDPKINKANYFYPEKDYLVHERVKNFTAFEDRAGTVHLNFDGQISFYDARNNKLSLLSDRLNNYPRSKNVVRYYYDPVGVLWVGSGYDGIDKMVFQENPFTYTLVRPSNEERESNEIRGIYCDPAGNLWMANKRGELFVSQGGKRIPSYSSEGLNNTSGIYFIKGTRQGQIWLATKGNGLYYGKMNMHSGAIGLKHFVADERNPESISSNDIYCILEDKTGGIWAGAFDQGLIRVDQSADEVRFQTLKNSFRNYPKNEFRKIRHLAQDQDGLIWIATTDGLLIFDPRSNRPENYTFKAYKKESGNIHSLGGNDIQYIYPDSKGQVWILTTTGGLNLAVGSNPMKSLSFVNYSTKHGLPSDFLLSCIEDKQQNLWIATQNGLSKFAANRKSFQNFNQSDGLGMSTFSESSCAGSPDGKLVFGTTNGYLSFYPNNIHTHKITAPMVITKLQINSKVVETGDGSPLKYQINYTKRVELDYDQNTLSFDYAVLDFHSTNKQIYAYRLLGYDDVWRSSEGQRSVSFTKLPPGNYTFQVKSLNDELYKEIPSATLEIVVHPPFWRSWWAYLTYLIIFAGIIILIRRNAITLLQLKQRVAVEQQVAELKVDFFNQISHELRTPLTMIISPSEEIQQQEALSQKGSEYIAVVLSNARRMLHLVNQVLNLRKVQSGKESLVKTEVEINTLIKELIFSFKQTIDQRKLSIELMAGSDRLVGWLDRHKFEVIFYNLLGNAIKFSDDGAKIWIKLNSADRPGYFQLTVADEGRGVSDNDLHQIFNLYFQGSHLPLTGIKGTGIGLALSKELVDLHQGKIWATHNHPRGLKITLELEQSQAALNYQYQGSTQVEDPESEIELNESNTLIKRDLPSLLIVEDNQDLQKFLKDKFLDTYLVTTASDGEEGLEKARAMIPNLILSDVMMPKKDGIQLLDELKNDGSTSHIPVILLSAKFSIESQIEGLKYGADYYLAKPFNFALLKAAVDNIIIRRKYAFQQIQNQTNTVDKESVLTEYDRLFLAKILQVVENSLNEPSFNIDDVAESLGMSRSAFYRKFKSLTDTAPIDFVKETRLKKAKEILDAGETNISVVAYSVGFSSPKYFTLCFKSHYAQTPSDYLKSIRIRKSING